MDFFRRILRTTAISKPARLAVTANPCQSALHCLCSTSQWSSKIGKCVPSYRGTTFGPSFFAFRCEYGSYGKLILERSVYFRMVPKRFCIFLAKFIVVVRDIDRFVEANAALSTNAAVLRLSWLSWSDIHSRGDWNIIRRFGDDEKRTDWHVVCLFPWTVSRNCGSFLHGEERSSKFEQPKNAILKWVLAACSAPSATDDFALFCADTWLFLYNLLQYHSTLI